MALMPYRLFSFTKNKKNNLRKVSSLRGVKRIPLKAWGLKRIPLKAWGLKRVPPCGV
jgi:hypothetical protein